MDYEKTFATLLNHFCDSKIYNMYDYFTCAKTLQFKKFKITQRLPNFKSLHLYTSSKKNQRNCIKI